jgi:hypothetical protein
MKNKELVKMISVTLGSFSLAACFLIWGLLSGFEMGYFYGVFQDPPSNGFGAHGPNFFQSINIWYFIIGVGFCIYIIGESIKPLVASSAVCILSLIVSIYPYWDMLSFKKEILSMQDKFSYDYWLNNSIYFDWCLLFTSIILMFIQFTKVSPRGLNTETYKIN